MHCSTMRPLVLLCFFLEALGFSLFDLQTSYVQFERLRDKADGRIGVSFRFKTYVGTGMLFYVDDKTQWSGEYLSFYLRDGFLVSELSDGTGNVHTAQSKAAINDREWHRIEVKLSPHHAVYVLDNTTLSEFNLTAKLKFESNVFIGGFPQDINIFWLSHDTIFFEQRFLGCVEDVRFSYESVNSTESLAPKVMKSSGMNLICVDACKPRDPCKNGGVCINKFAVAECSCTETGYRGKTCEKESPVVGISSAEHRVTFDIYSSFVSVSTKTTSMFIRFRSTQPDGVFFYTSHQGDFILLELTNGKVAASVNLGSGSVTIATRKGGYNDNQWHGVKLNRVKRLVNLTVDNLDTSEGKTRGSFDKFHLPNKKTSFILGGLSADKKTLSKSVSRKNFTGCLQELIFNGYDVFWKFNTSAKEVFLRGNILKSCPKAPTELPQVQSTTTKTDIMTNSTSASDAFSTTPFHTTAQKLPCVLAGIPCKSSTTRIFVQETSTDTLSSTSGKRVSTKRQSPTTFKALNHTTIESKVLKTTTRSSKTTQDTFKSSPGSPRTSPKVSVDNGVAQTTDNVKMASRNERSEGDLTVWFILAAVVGLVAFLLAILIIVKVNSTNRKKYAVKRQKNNQKDYWTNTGSFQRSTKPLV